MTEKELIINKSESENVSIGDYFIYSHHVDDLYVVATVDGFKVCLVNVCTGVFWDGFIKPEETCSITQFEMEALIGSAFVNDFKRVRKLKFEVDC